jgi:hypothetical protein
LLDEVGKRERSRGSGRLRLPSRDEAGQQGGDEGGLLLAGRRWSGGWRGADALEPPQVLVDGPEEWYFLEALVGVAVAAGPAGTEAHVAYATAQNCPHYMYKINQPSIILPFFI